MKPNKDSKCGVCATNPFERNKYFYGKQFTVRDLLQEQSYLNDKRYLINRMVLGWGVVCGLDVYWDRERRRLVVKSGMALDCCGHEIVVCENQYLSFDKNDDDCCLEHHQMPKGKFVLCLEYHECEAEPIDLQPVGCDEKGKSEYNRVRDSFRLRLKNWDDACPKEPHEPIACINRYKHDATANDSGTRNCETEDIHHYLCRKLKKHCHECESCDCVILATITIEEVLPPPPPTGKQDPGTKPKDQGQQGGGYGNPQQGGSYQNPQQGGGPQYPQPGGDYKDPVVDSCTNRKLVYSNTLLYDLIYCYHGDLPHIVDFNWRKYAYPKREMNFDTFVQMMRDGVTVYFDQEIAPASLNAHTFIICYLYRESGTHTYVRRHIRPEEILVGKEGNCHTATFKAREDWIREELDTANSELRADTRYERGVSVEITLRGSRIWSKLGKGLDGEYLADRLPTGNGTQGGDFVDWFMVVPAEEKPPKGKSLADQF